MPGQREKKEERIDLDYSTILSSTLPRGPRASKKREYGYISIWKDGKDEQGQQANKGLTH